MNKAGIPTELTFDQLYDGHGKSVSNGLQLVESAVVVHSEFPEVALGLAQLGQEEIGKSLSFLSAFFLPQKFVGWDWFWSGWRNHELKAHRAFLYELIHPWRMVIKKPDGSDMDGGPFRKRINHEKEASFYVDFDNGKKTFVSPKESVSPDEVFQRVTTALYLGITAFHVKQGLDKGDVKFNYRTFSEICLRICSQDIYQQDMPTLLAEFGKRSASHAKLLTDLQESLERSSEFLQGLMGKHV